MKRATPKPYRAVESCDKVRRQVFCVHYDDCLDYVIAKRWSGFTCDGCTAFQREQWSHEAWEKDTARCLRLAESIAFAAPQAGTPSEVCIGEELVVDSKKDSVYDRLHLSC